MSRQPGPPAHRHRVDGRRHPDLVTGVGPAVSQGLLRRRAGLPAGHPDRERLRRAAIIASLPMARQLAHRYAGRGEPLDDLVQVASLALVKAVDDYDPGRVETFAGYAVPTILGTLKNHFRDRTWDIRVPRRLRELAADATAATEELSQRLRRPPTTAELAAHLRVEPGTAAEAVRVAQAYRLPSLNRPATPGGWEELIDAVGADDPGFARVDTRVALRPLLAALPARERRALAMRFFEGMTQAQIGAELGVSAVHAARLVLRSLTRLRAGLDG